MLEIGDSYKCIISKSSQPISINFFLKETRIFSLQNYEEFLSKFHLGDFLQRFEIWAQNSLCYVNFFQRPSALSYKVRVYKWVEGFGFNGVMGVGRDLMEKSILEKSERGDLGLTE